MSRLAELEAFVAKHKLRADRARSRDQVEIHLKRDEYDALVALAETLVAGYKLARSRATVEAVAELDLEGSEPT